VALPFFVAWAEESKGNLSVERFKARQKFNGPGIFSLSFYPTLVPTSCILSGMESRETFHESRRSTRVPLKVVITVVVGAAETVACEGETIVVSCHGALIATAIELSEGMKISIHVYITDRRAPARIVYVDPQNPRHCGIELDEPGNIWGVPLSPADWGDQQS